MMIQRWQSVWLLLAAILTGFFCFIPMATIAGGETAADPGSFTPIYPSQMQVFFCVNLLVTLLLFLAIFLFKNTRLQKSITLISMLLILCSLATEALMLFGWNSAEGQISWTGSVFLLIGGFVLAAFAYRGICKDERLLRAADRIR